MLGLRWMGLCTAAVLVLGCGDDETTTTDGGGTASTSATSTSTTATSTSSTGATTSASGSSSGSSSGATTDATGGSTGMGSTGGEIQTCEPYPVPWAPAPDARQNAETALAALSPAATMTWNDARGTLISISDLNLPLPACADGTDALAHAWTAVEAVPELFGLDRTEWIPASPLPCEIVQGSDRTMTMSRARLGGDPVLRDIFVFRLRRIGGVVNIRSVNGTYLPATTPELTEAMGLCRALDEVAAVATVQSTPLPYTIFNQCVPIGTGDYTMVSSDTIEFDPEPFWLWTDDDANGQVLLTKQRASRAIVAPANHTPDLLGSDAACPGNPGGVEVGFRITLDSVTGVFGGSMPGIECIVC